MLFTEWPTLEYLDYLSSKFNLILPFIELTHFIGFKLHLRPFVCLKHKHEVSILNLVCKLKIF